LVPCLMADPMTASALNTSLSPHGWDHRSDASLDRWPSFEREQRLLGRVGVRGDVDQTLFSQAALMLALESSCHPLHVFAASLFRRKLRLPAAASPAKLKGSPATTWRVIFTHFQDAPFTFKEFFPKRGGAESTARLELNQL